MFINKLLTYIRIICEAKKQQVQRKMYTKMKIMYDLVREWGYRHKLSNAGKPELKLNISEFTDHCRVCRYKLVAVVWQRWGSMCKRMGISSDNVLQIPIRSNIHLCKTLSAEGCSHPPVCTNMSKYIHSSKRISIGNVRMQLYRRKTIPYTSESSLFPGIHFLFHYSTKYHSGIRSI